MNETKKGLSVKKKNFFAFFMLVFSFLQIIFFVPSFLSPLPLHPVHRRGDLRRQSPALRRRDDALALR